MLVHQITQKLKLMGYDKFNYIKVVKCSTTSALAGSWYLEFPISALSLFWYWYLLSKNLKSVFSLFLYGNPPSNWFSAGDVRSPIFSCDEKMQSLCYNNLSISIDRDNNRIAYKELKTRMMEIITAKKIVFLTSWKLVRRTSIKFR